VQAVSFGEAFELSPPLIDLLSDYAPRELGERDFAALHTDWRARCSLQGGVYLYLGTGSLAAPNIGDVRVWFRTVESGTVTVLAEQASNSFLPCAYQ
jgi:hypothetical protein